MDLQILNRARTVPPASGGGGDDPVPPTVAAAEPGPWRMVADMLVSMRAQIEALSTSVAGVEVMGESPLTAAEIAELTWCEVKIGGKIFLLPVKE